MKTPWAAWKKHQESAAIKKQEQDTEAERVHRAFIDITNNLDDMLHRLWADTDMKTREKTINIDEPIRELKKALSATRESYIKKKINLETLKTQWEDAITTHMDTLDKLHDPADVAYHNVHKAIQTFLRWAQFQLQKIGLSKLEKENPDRKPWIKEQPTTVKYSDDIKGFREKLRPDDEAETDRDSLGSQKK
ncbi:MAG: hypothetical protein K0U37_07465 [Gammaproteobacteria bacterium]|nr:hypothetical protein [Gammaproteobacteria bacterium]